MFSVFVRQKVTINENRSFTDYALGIRLPDCSKLAKNWEMTMASQFAKMNIAIAIENIIVNFFAVVLFLLSISVTGPSSMSISYLVLEIWQFPFVRDWLEIRKSVIPPSEFCAISGDWVELRIPNVVETCLI